MNPSIHVDIDGQILDVHHAGTHIRYHKKNGDLHRLGGPAYYGRTPNHEYWINGIYKPRICHGIEVLIITGKPTPGDIARFFRDEDGPSHAHLIIEYMQKMNFPASEIKRLYTNACAYWQLEFGYCPDKLL